VTLKRFHAAFLGAALLATAGCATTGAPRSSQADLDSLNAKVSRLEGELAEKEAEIAKLQNRMREEESARAQAESDRRRAADELEAARAALASSKKTAERAAAPEPDLK